MFTRNSSREEGAPILSKNSDTLIENYAASYRGSPPSPPPISLVQDQATLERSEPRKYQTSGLIRHALLTNRWLNRGPVVVPPLSSTVLNANRNRACHGILENRSSGRTWTVSNED